MNIQIKLFSQEDSSALFSRQIEEAKRLTRRMGDCFTSEIIDLTTTHIILPNDDPHMPITLDLILALIYRW